MTKLIADASLPAKLVGLIQPVELCDPSGRVLGRFFPALDPTQFNLEPQISREELQLRKEYKGKTYTTEEVLNHLRNL